MDRRTIDLARWLAAGAVLTACGDEGSIDAGTDGSSATSDAMVDAAAHPPDASVASDGASDDQSSASSDASSASSLPIGHCGATEGRYFPANAWMYTDISSAPVHPRSTATTTWLEGQGGWGLGRMQIDTSFVVLDAEASSPRVAPVVPDPGERYDSCDNDVAVPIPTGGRVEGYPDYVCPGRSDGDYEGDCHLLVVDHASSHLFESFSTSYVGGALYSTCVIDWDMTRDLWGAPPASSGPLPTTWGIGRSCTSADAAGFPIAPLLFNVTEVSRGRIEHAIRFILPNARMQRSGEGPLFVWPATHAGGPSNTDADAPIYGSRWRLRADFDPAAAGLDPQNLVVRAVVYGLQHYGMVLADGGNVALTAESDEGCGTTWESLWGEDGARVLAGIEPHHFEVLDTGPASVRDDCVRAN